MTTEVEIQRRRDGAFFEDWSAWADLGSGPSYRYISPQMGSRRRLHEPSYHCLLMERLPFDGRAGFEVTTPRDNHSWQLCKSIPGAYQPRLIKGACSNFVRWYIPAESWQQLRAILPELSRITREKVCGG